jgi:hypothetical protein
MSKVLRLLAAGLLVAFGVGILVFTLSEKEAASRDFICYWAAGQQLVHHANPYSAAGVLATQQAAGYSHDKPFFMRNPPIAFFLALPLGLVGARLGAILWSLAIIAALVGSVRLLWILHGRSEDRIHLVSYCFPPVLACLLAGQIGIFMLLGLSLFLFLHRSRPYLAGASLLLPMLKPHLFLAFGAVLLLWAVRERAYRVLAGIASVAVAALGLAYLLDPRGWAHYAQMARAEHLSDEFIPTLSLMLRLAVHRSWLWLQFVPAAVACGWAVSYFYKHKDEWDWTVHGSVVLLVSVISSPYAWVTDESVILPAIMAGLYMSSSRALTVFSVVMCAALGEVLAGVKIGSGFYLWTAPAWLAWYMYASSTQRAAAESEIQGMAAPAEWRPASSRQV